MNRNGVLITHCSPVPRVARLRAPAPAARPPPSATASLSVSPEGTQGQKCAQGQCCHGSAEWERTASASGRGLAAAKSAAVNPVSSCPSTPATVKTLARCRDAFMLSRAREGAHPCLFLLLVVLLLDGSARRQRHQRPAHHNRMLSAGSFISARLHKTQRAGRATGRCRQEQAQHLVVARTERHFFQLLR